jgi:hypothetical protein
MLNAYYRSASGVFLCYFMCSKLGIGGQFTWPIGLKELDDRPRILFPTGMSWWSVAQVDDAVSEASSSS